NLEEKHVTWARFGKKLDKDTILGLSVHGDGVRIYCDVVRNSGVDWWPKSEMMVAGSRQCNALDVVDASILWMQGYAFRMDDGSVFPLYCRNWRTLR
ncbi:hypothetical protein Tco_1494058, partial [Tanacetum coccineum]